MRNFAVLVLTIFAGIGCKSNKADSKGFQVNEISEDEHGQKVVGIPFDSLDLESRPGSVLLTSNPAHRLVPVFKVNYNPRNGLTYTGTCGFHSLWYEEDEREGDNWNSNFMPGLSAMYGFNLINISVFNIEKETQKKLFDSPVLVKTLYYPAFSKDTLNHQPVSRDYYLVSVYNKDTNRDGFINMKDLRRLLLFDLDGEMKKEVIPDNYSVMSSEFDPGNDLMFVFAKLDQNANGQMELEEETHIFWINLKNPERSGVLYQ